MPSQPLHPSRAKYLALLKQTTGIEFDLVPESEPHLEQKAIRQTNAGDQIYIKNADLTLLQRATRREQILMSREQNNLEQIFSLALEFVNQDAQFERLDLDWLMKFTELAKQSFSPTKQELWAKILAVELSQIGTFSFRSLKTLSEISAQEAMLFYRSVSLACRIGDEKGAKILTGLYKKPTLMSIFSGSSRTALNLNKFGLSYPKLMTLGELGLVYAQEIESAPYKENDEVHLNYNGQPIIMKMREKEVIFTYYKFTQTGYELSKLVASEKDNNYLKSLMADFKGLVEFKNVVTTTS